MSIFSQQRNLFLNPWKLLFIFLCECTNFNLFLLLEIGSLMLHQFFESFHLNLRLSFNSQDHKGVFFHQSMIFKSIINGQTAALMLSFFFDELGKVIVILHENSNFFMIKEFQLLNDEWALIAVGILTGECSWVHF